MHLAAKHGKCIPKEEQEQEERSSLVGKPDNIKRNCMHFPPLFLQQTTTESKKYGICFVCNYVILSHALRCCTALMFRSHFLNGHQFSVLNNIVRANYRIILSICQQRCRLTCVSLSGTYLRESLYTNANSLLRDSSNLFNSLNRCLTVQQLIGRSVLGVISNKR